eukprot:809101-Pleurochrysis_carterae.AAC.1
MLSKQKLPRFCACSSTVVVPTIRNGTFVLGLLGYVNLQQSSKECRRAINTQLQLQNARWHGTRNGWPNDTQNSS